jgi:hypothetical protein
MPKHKITREDFVTAWQSASSVKDVADQLGISQKYASVRAVYLRQQGEDLKHMPNKAKSEDNKRLMTRSTEEEFEAWHEAAKRASKAFGLPHLTVGPWSRMVLNQAARALGVKIPE